MKRSVIITTHIGFWIIVWFSLFSLFSFMGIILPPEEYRLTKWEVLRRSVVATGIGSVFFYVFYFFTKWISRNAKMIYPFIVLVLIYIVFSIYSNEKLGNTANGIAISLLFGVLGSLFQIIPDWYNKNKIKAELEQKNHESNLALLRSQINPHFLFNTLHNIDTLIYDNQDKASKSLAKLSDIMRYMLTDTDSEFVNLKQEIEYIESYISLEKLRLKNDKFLSFSITGNYTNYKIAPMLLIPFIENAFKHSIDSSVDKGLNIWINVENEKLDFVCENLFDKSDADKDKTSGIGLETVKKRLELIYQNSYKLLINSTSSIYKVNLEIDLHDN